MLQGAIMTAWDPYIIINSEASKANKYWDQKHKESRTQLAGFLHLVKMC